MTLTNRKVSEEANSKKIWNTNDGFRHNSLNTLKVISALEVMIIHASAHMSVALPSWLSYFVRIFSGVPVFFVLSGFLIWNSVGKSNSFKEYAFKRFWRIYPELWIGVAVSIITILIFYKEAIKWLMMPVFAITQGTFFQFWTPDFLRGYGCGTPNGSLWTIGITIQFYIIVWMAFRILNKKPVLWWVVAFIFSVGMKVVMPYMKTFLPAMAYDVLGVTIFRYLWLFVLGAFLAEYREYTIPFMKKTWWVLMILSFLVSELRIDFDSGHYGVILYSLRVPALIGLAYSLPKFNIKLDVSYGVYIYHMIVINVFIALGYCGKWYYLLIAVVLSIAIATASTVIANSINKKVIKIKKNRG